MASVLADRCVATWIQLPDQAMAPVELLRVDTVQLPHFLDKFPSAASTSK